MSELDAAFVEIEQMTLPKAFIQVVGLVALANHPIPASASTRASLLSGGFAADDQANRREILSIEESLIAIRRH